MINYKKKYEQKMESMKSTKRIKETEGIKNVYDIGVRNGIEICLAILEDRDPVLIPVEEQKEETEQKPQRTKFYGKRSVTKSEKS